MIFFSSIKNSLLFKWVLTAVAIVTIVFALLTPVSLRLVETVAEEHIRTHSAEMSLILNSALSASLFSRNSVLAEETLTELFSQPEQNISYILVYDNKGNIFSQAGSINPELLPSIDENLIEAREDGTYDTQSLLKLDNEILGKVRYGLSLHNELDLTDEIKKQGTFVIASALLATAGLFSLFGFGLTRQLKKLINATHAIAAGDYNKQVKVSSEDEIGQLSSNFNTMADAIHNNTHIIQENKRFLQGITDNIEGMIYRCSNNRQWTLAYASAGAEKLTGYKLSDLIIDEGFDFSALILEDERERVWNEVQQAFSNSNKFTVTYRIQTSKGEIKWILDRGSQIENDESLIEGIMIDITAQKQAEIERQKIDERLNNVVENSIQGIFVHRNWRPLYANIAFAKTLGFDSVTECLAIDSLASLISKRDLPRLRGYLQAREKGQYAPQHYEYEGLKKDGSKILIETTVTHIDWEGEPALQNIIMDISEQRKAELQSAQYLEQLAQLNRVNILGEMTAGIAHEINQPLTSIVTRSGAARRRLAAKNMDLEKIDNALESISKQALRAGDVMQKMRDLVDVHQSVRDPVDPNTLIEDALMIIRIDGTMINTHVETTLTPELPLVKVDKIQIQQVILNLLRNAQDAMQHLPNDERIITLKSARLDDDFIKITVKDRGKGIEAKVEKKLLKSFFTTKESGMGMGLGLSISRTIITAHSGQLWFSRNEDKGVSFHITLPIAHTPKTKMTELKSV